ncbi:thioester-containing protein-like protein, partial [Leptotrombidium deliense]
PYAVYTIVASGKLIPNSNYCVSIDVKDADDSIQLNVSIINTNSIENSLLVNETTLILANERKEIELPIGNWSKQGEYLLSIKCEGGLEVQHESKLSLEVVGIMIFVETDKAVYKPRQIVQFRTVIIDSNLKPVSKADIQIRIKDANRNVIKLYNGVTSNNGIFSGELQLTDQPMLGEWAITVEAVGQNYQKYFTVAEYVLPAFTVAIKVPSFITSKSHSFVSTVNASYTYGKPVKGNMTLTVSEVFWSEEKKKFVFKSDINGEISVPIEMTDLIEGHFYGMKKFSLKASVTDFLSERTTQTNLTVSIYSDQYEFRLLQRNKNFKTGFKYKIMIKVSFRDGKPVENNGPPLKVKYGYDTVNTFHWHEVSQVPINGIVVVVLNTTYPYPTATTTTPHWRRPTRPTISGRMRSRKVRSIRPPGTYSSRPSRIAIDVSYKDINTRVGSISHTKESENCFIQIDVKDYPFKKFKVGDTVDVSIVSVSPLNDVNYRIIGRKGIVLKKHISATRKKHRNFSITLSHDMAPRMRLFVYQICIDSISTDFVEIDVNGVFQNFVNIDANVTSVEPHSDVNIRISTNAHSSVSLMAIDQKMLQFKSGNSIDKQTVVILVLKKLPAVHTLSTSLKTRD